MRLLLDTHALLWFLDNDPKLSAPAKSGIAHPANERFLSAASLVEIAVKIRVGKLRSNGGMSENRHFSRFSPHSAIAS